MQTDKSIAEWVSTHDNDGVFCKKSQKKAYFILKLMGLASLQLWLWY